MICLNVLIICPLSSQLHDDIATMVNVFFSSLHPFCSHILSRHWSQFWFLSLFPFSKFQTQPPSSPTTSLFLHPVFCHLARPLFHGGGPAGHWCAMSFSERSQEFTASEPPLSHISLFPLPRFFSFPASLALSHFVSPFVSPPAYPVCLPTSIHITWVSEIDSLLKEWELEQMEYEWFTRVWKRCLGEGSGVEGPSIASKVLLNPIVTRPSSPIKHTNTLHPQKKGNDALKRQWQMTAFHP